MARRRHDQPIALADLVDMLKRAYQFWNAGNADQAEILCQRVLAAWPGQADALHLLGLMAHAYGRTDQAIAHLRQACLAPRAPGLFFRNLTEMCRQKGLLDEGERAGRQAVALEPRDADCWNNLGIVLQESGKISESLECLRRAAELRPNDPQILTNLGNTYRLAGNAEEAERRYRLALDQSPDHVQALSNLAGLSVLYGNFDAGIAYARQALASEPQFADAYINLADIESLRYNHAEALRWIDTLLAFAPNHVVALGVRARILLQSGHGDEALGVVRRASALAPDDGAVMNRLGEVLHALGHVEEALDAYARAAGRAGRHVEDALVNRALLLRECGRSDAADSALEDVLARFPDSPRALVARADAKTYQHGDPDIAALERLATACGRSDFPQRLGARFALGKIYLDLGDGERAFAHLDAANKQKRDTFPYDPARASAWLAAIVAAEPRPITPVTGASDSSRPVFVVGMPRSGSSLLEQILASHPQIAGAGELPALRLAVDRAGVFPDPSWSDEIWRGIGHDYLQATAGLGGGRPRLIDKMPSNFVYAGVIARALPNARIIHCRRDPVDTCLSCYAKHFLGEQPFCYDQRELGLFYRDYRQVMAHWRRVLPAGQMVEVDYEAVVDDLEGQVRRVLDFLGLPWDDACLAFHRTPRVVRTASATQVRQPLYRGAVGRWRAYADHLVPLLTALGDVVE